MNRGFLWSLCAWLVAGELAAQPAAPATGGVIVLAWSEGSDGLVARLRAELRAADARIVEHPGAVVVDLAALAGEQRADAVIAVSDGGRSVQLWVARAPDARDVLVADAAQPDEAVLAVRVTETLRARGLALVRRTPPSAATTERSAGTAPAAEPNAQPAPPATTAPAAEPSTRTARPEPDAEPDAAPIAIAADVEPRSRWQAPPLQLWLELAPAVLASPGGLDASMQVLASARVQYQGLVSAALIGAVPVLGADVAAAEGSARVATSLFGIALDGSFERERFGLSLGGGAAGVISAVHGTARAPLDSQRATVRSAAVFARAGLHLRVIGGLRLCGRFALGTTFPGLTVRFVERDAAHWGRPFMLATLGLELPIPLPAAAR